MLIDEFSYAEPSHSLPRILLIRAVEMLSGQPHLKRLYEEYRKERLPFSGFWGEVIKRLQLKLEFYGNQPDVVPATGPLIVVANHPYGVLDGIAICWLVAQRRKDFKILINSVLCRAEEMAEHVLPVDFEPTEIALQTNLASRQKARELLAAGGALIVFPAGAISTTGKMSEREAVDAPWAPLVGQLIRRSKAQVLPVYFEGQNSALFQWASHINGNLRVALIFHEVRRRIGSRLRIAIGDVMTYAQLEPHLPAKPLSQYLRQHTHGLKQLIDSSDSSSEA